MVWAAEPAPETWWFQDHAISGVQPRRINAPMSPVEMNVPARNQVLTIVELMMKTARYAQRRRGGGPGGSPSTVTGCARRSVARRTRRARHFP